MSGSARVRQQRHALVHDLLANLGRAAALRERRPSFLGRPRLQGTGHERNQIAGRVRLEHHRVTSRLERHRVPRRSCFVDRSSGHAGEVELRPVALLGPRPPRSGSVIRARGDRVVRVGASMVGEQPRAVADRRRTRRRDEEARDLDVLRRTRRCQRGQRRLGSIIGRERCRGLEPRGDLRVLLRAELAKILRVFGCETRQRFRLLHCAAQAIVGATVGDDGCLPLAEDALHPNVRGRRRTGGAHLVRRETDVRFPRALNVHADRVGLRELDARAR